MCMNPVILLLLLLYFNVGHAPGTWRVKRYFWRLRWKGLRAIDLGDLIGKIVEFSQLSEFKSLNDKDFHLTVFCCSLTCVSLQLHLQTSHPQRNLGQWQHTVPMRNLHTNTGKWKKVQGFLFLMIIVLLRTFQYFSLNQDHWWCKPGSVNRLFLYTSCQSYSRQNLAPTFP